MRTSVAWDLPALVSRVLYETRFEKLALVCHSQGASETLVALAKDQRPELGERISVFCALAPAAYAGPLIKKMYFRFMSMLSTSMFRLCFGIHAFIPFMMTMHKLLPPSAGVRRAGVPGVFVSIRLDRCAMGPGPARPDVPVFARVLHVGPL